MPKQEGQKSKLLTLLRILEQKTDEEHLLNVPQLVELLEQQDILAERKSIYSDIDTLRSLGYDIQLRRGRGGGYWLASRTFELSELKLLVDAVQASKVVSARTSSKLIHKLEALCSDYEGTQLQRQVYVDGRPKSDSHTLLYSIDALHSAINAGRMVRFRYKDGGTRTVNPWQLAWENGCYYLIAYQDEKEPAGIRNYRVDRMSSVTVLGDARRGKAMGGTKSRKGRFQLVSCGSPLAAHTQHPDTGYQMQRFRGCFSRGKGQGKIRRFSCPSQRHPGGRGALHGPVRCQPDSVPGQQRPADQLDSLRLQHGAALGFGPLIHGKQAVGIGRRGDHRNRTTGGSQPAGQVICAAQMAGEQRHRKAAAFIQHHNGGVGGLALAVGRNGPHRNARRPHKHQGIRRGKLLGRPPGQRHPAQPAAADGAGAGLGQLLRQRQPLGRKGKIRTVHSLVPSRYSVVKAGSYSLLRA